MKSETADQRTESDYCLEVCLPKTHWLGEYKAISICLEISHHRAEKLQATERLCGGLCSIEMWWASDPRWILLSPPWLMMGALALCAATLVGGAALLARLTVNQHCGARAPVAPQQTAELGEHLSPSSLLTVVVVTSPNHSNPDTTVLRHVLASFSVVPQLLACRVIIACDGFSPAATQSSGPLKQRKRPVGAVERAVHRRGELDEHHAAKYRQYRARVRRAVDERRGVPWDGEVELVMCDRWVGFAGAVELALEKVQTPYVMVVQNDRCFGEGFDLRGVLSAMQENQQLKYVMMPTASTRTYLQYSHQRFKIEPAPLIKSFKGFSICPLYFWYDSTHICSVKHYREWVFARSAPGSTNRLCGVDMAAGCFIETTLGNYQTALVEKQGWAAHAQFGTWLLVPNSSACKAGAPIDVVVKHMDGRGSARQRLEQRAAELERQTGAGKQTAREVRLREAELQRLRQVLVLSGEEDGMQLDAI